jgi:hypothetical protein
MASQKGSPTHSLSGYSAKELDNMRTYKPTKWYKNLMSQSQHKALYNEKLLTQEYEPDPNWKMPKVPASEIYNLSVFQFRAATLIRYCSVNILISLGQSKYQLPLIQQEDIEWGLKHGFEYIHIGLIQFGLNALVLIIGIDWLEAHRALVDCFTKRVLCADDEGRPVEIKGVQRRVSLRFISTMKVKR